MFIIITSLRNLKEIYPKWFVRFSSNFKKSFSGLDAEGITMVSSQRPSNSFTYLNDAKFKQYVLGKFQRFIDLIAD